MNAAAAAAGSRQCRLTTHSFAKAALLKHSVVQQTASWCSEF